MAKAVLIIGSAWWVVSVAIHWLSAWKGRRPCRPVPASHHAAADFSVVAPMVGEGDATAAYIDSLKTLADAGAEVLVCVAREDDDAVAAVRRRWSDAPVLIGAEARFTAKVNNVEKGFRAATRPVVALCDAGTMLTVDLLVHAAAPLSDKTGLVLALKAAEYAENFPAEIERAYIDGHGARFLFAADWLGLPVASGGVTLLSRETLERIGYGDGFTRFIADDYSVTDSVRRLDLGTQLSDVMPGLPLGKRRWRDVWRRQVRWARTRLRLPVWPLVLWEPLIGWLASMVMGLVALAAADVAPEWVVAAALGHTALWLVAEKWFMAGRGLAFGPRAALAALAREALAPALMATALSGRSMPWRDADLGKTWRERGISGAESPVWNGMPADEIRTVVLPDRLDSVTAAEVERLVIDQLRPGGEIIVDGRAVTYMSAAGVRTFASVIHRAADQGARVVFCRFTGAAADCLAVSGFTELFDMSKSPEEASGRLRSAADRRPEGRLHPPVGAG
jgi:anti-anti-sigma factor